MGLIVLLVSLLSSACFGIRLPGLEEEVTETSPESLSAYSHFATSRVLNAKKESMTNDTKGQPAISLTITRSQPLLPQNESREHQMERLLDMLFGNRSWRSYMKNLTMRVTSSKPTQSSKGNDESAAQRPLSSGFFSNQISAGSVFNRHEQENANTPRPSAQSYLHNYFQVPQFGHGEDLNKIDMKYTGSFINSNLHVPKVIEITTRPPQLPFVFHVPVTRPSSQTNVEQVYRGPASIDQNTQYSSSIMSETFDPNAVNHFQGGFNPNNSPAAFATQTGSNPQNSRLQVNYDADKVNTNFMQGNMEGIESNIPPGVVPFLSLQSPGDSENFSNRLSRYDANQLNHDLLGRNWAISGNPPNIMEPTFLTDNSNSQSLSTNKIGHSDSPASMTDRSYDTQRKGQLTKKSDDVSTERPLLTGTGDRVHTPLVLTDSVITHFNFVPGNLDPSLGQNLNEQQNLENLDANSMMTLFDPNSINSQQVVFNPNSVSWIIPRGLKRRNPNKRKLNQHGLVNNNILGSFDNASSSSQANQLAQDMKEEGNNVDKNRSEQKLLFGSSETFMKNSIRSDAYNHTGFNPNTLNTDQGQNNFIPGQIAPYGSVSNTLGGSSVLGYFYGPHSDSNLLNFNVESQLGIGNKNTSGDTGFGVVGMFNPSSLNNILISFVTGNKHQSDNGQDIPRQGPYTAFNLSSAFGMFSDFASNTNHSARNFGYMNGGFDANAANLGFGDIIKGSGSSGFGFGSSNANNSSSWQASAFGSFGTGSSFDPKKVNAGFGASGYGKEVLNGPAGAFGGSFNADEINAGGNSTDVHDLMNYFLGVKMKPEGGIGPGSTETELYDSRFIGAFNPDSVNQVSYDPNKINILNIHFIPSEMLEKNPGMDKNILTSVGNLFDPEKVNSLYKQQTFKPNEMLHMSGVGQITFDHSDKENMEHKWNERNKSNLPIFDPFEVMKQLMLDTFHIKSSVNNFAITPETTSKKATMNLQFSKPTLTPFSISTSTRGSSFSMTTADTASGKPLVTSMSGGRIPLQTAQAQSTTAKPA